MRKSLLEMLSDINDEVVPVSNVGDKAAIEDAVEKEDTSEKQEDVIGNKVFRNHKNKLFFGAKKQKTPKKIELPKSELTESIESDYDYIVDIYEYMDDELENKKLIDSVGVSREDLINKYGEDTVLKAENGVTKENIDKVLSSPDSLLHSIVDSTGYNKWYSGNRTKVSSEFGFFSEPRIGKYEYESGIKELSKRLGKALLPNKRYEESLCGEEPEVKENFSDEYAPHDDNWAEYKKPYVVDPHHKLTPERKAELEKQGIEIKESINEGDFSWNNFSLKQGDLVDDNYNYDKEEGTSEYEIIDAISNSVIGYAKVFYDNEGYANVYKLEFNASDIPDKVKHIDFAGDYPIKHSDDLSSYCKWLDSELHKRLNESLREDYSQFEYITSKSVPDYDGFMTDYTMYYDNQDKRYVFVFGDNEVYLPEDEDFDYECDTEKEAYEWFDNYEGFVDDYMNESIKINEAPDEFDYASKFNLVSMDLLSIDEAAELPRPIRRYKGCEWWLRTNGYSEFNAAVVFYDNSISDVGRPVNDTFITVRPALKISNLDFDFRVGDEVIINNQRWIVINNKQVLYNDEPIYHMFDSVINYYETSEIKRFIDEWFNEIKASQKGTTNESINEKLVDAPKEVLDAVMDVLIKNDFKLDSSIKHENPFNYDGRWHIQVINDNEKVTDEDDFYAKMEKYDAMLDEISEIGDRENCPVTYNFGANRDMYITGGIDIREKYIEESLKENYYQDIENHLYAVINDDDGTYAGRPCESDDEARELVGNSDRPRSIYKMNIIKEPSNINESTSEHHELEKEVYTIVENLIDEALDNLAMRLPEMIAGYNPDWCADESGYDFVHYKGEFIDAIVSELFKNDYGDIEESLTEASYGGAYDIADDQYFTKDELVEFAEEIIDELDCGKCELVDVEMDGNALSICIDCDGVEECVTITIDMRKIKSHRHIMKYTTPFVKEFTKRFCTTNESMELNELNLKNVDADELQYQKDMKAYRDSLTPNEAMSDKIYNQLTNTAYNKKYGAKAIDYEAVLLDEEDNNVVCADDMTRALNVCEKEGYKHSEPRPLGKGENGSVYGSYKMTIYNPKV